MGGTMARMAGLFFCVTPAGGPAGSEVLAEGEQGFDLKLAVTVPLGPAAAFSAFTGQIGAWWNGAHSYSGDSSKLSLTQECFCERWGESRVVHLHVGQFLPPGKLRLLGGLGPLQGVPLDGVMDVTFEASPPAGEETIVSLSYAVRGAELAAWAQPVHGVLEEQLSRFSRHAAGEPVGAP